MNKVNFEEEFRDKHFKSAKEVYEYYGIEPRIFMAGCMQGQSWVEVARMHSKKKSGISRLWSKLKGNKRADKVVVCSK